jgi:uncharacterized membrane protein
MNKTLQFLLCIVISGATFLIAHEAHKKKPTEVIQTYTAQSSTKAEAFVLQQQEEPPLPRSVQTIMRESVMSHFHNKIIHFPLALGITASILIFFSKRRPEMLPAIRILLVIAAVFAVAAYFTGKAQEEPFEHGEMHDILEWHERMGIISAILLWLGIFTTAFERTRKWLPLYAVLQFSVLAVVGFLGGILAHG